jgi:hypothetical protein
MILLYTCAATRDRGGVISYAFTTEERLSTDQVALACATIEFRHSPQLLEREVERLKRFGGGLTYRYHCLSLSGTWLDGENRPPHWSPGGTLIVGRALQDDYFRNRS